MKHILKTSLTLTAILFLFTSKIFATGAGFQVGLVPGVFVNETTAQVKNLTGNLTGTIRMSKIPVVAGAGVEAGKLFSDFNYGLSAFADYWAIDVQIKNTWSFYSGFGFSGKLLTSDFKNWNFAAGARFFVGTNYTFYDNYLEVYAQQNIVPTYLKNLNASGTDGTFMVCFPFEAGLRMHF